jgi:hypothetical protein
MVWFWRISQLRAFRIPRNIRESLTFLRLDSGNALVVASALEGPVRLPALAEDTIGKSAVVVKLLRLLALAVLLTVRSVVSLMSLFDELEFVFTYV